MFDVNAIRKDFPILGTKVYGHPLVYLDSGATAQRPECVTEKIKYLHENLNANIHRGVHHLSSEATQMYEQARETVRRFIGARYREEIVFTSGATAAINTVAYAWGNKYLNPGDNVIVSEMEHHSNLVPWQQIARQRGAELRVLPFDDDGRLKIESYIGLLDSRTKMVAVTQASNTLGTRPDLQPIISAAHSVGAVVLVDGCQGVVHGGVDVGDLGCDFYVFSGHKIYGPTGIGVLYGRREVLEHMPPFMFGGDMVDKVTFAETTFAPLPLRFEAGTSNFIGAIALGEALRYVESLPADEVAFHEKLLLDYTTDRLLEIDGLRIYGTTADKCPIVSFNVEGIHNYDIGMILDKSGIAIRTGHHCAEPVMQHYGVPGMCRVSLAVYNTEEEIDALAAGVKRAVNMLR
ncbi:MAG: SufS family cysteine desulfurase [Alistipes sp.]|nr:SufS family cysteine desulfurase [Alistipes sp.]